MPDVVTPKELRELSDEELVRLIEERTNLRGGQAWEALYIIRGGPPKNQDWDVVVRW